MLLLTKLPGNYTPACLDNSPPRLKIHMASWWEMPTITNSVHIQLRRIYVFRNLFKLSWERKADIGCGHKRRVAAVEDTIGLQSYIESYPNNNA